MKSEALSCARAQVLVEPYLDGVLAGMRLQRMELHLQSCAACRGELAAARSIQSELRTLPRLSCPGVVVDQVFRQVAASQPEGLWARMRASIVETFGASIWRPAAAMAGVAAVTLVIAMLSHQPLMNGYTPHEVARAEVEARYAFAIVAQVTTRASDSALDHVLGGVMRDVMGSQVIVPITDAVQKPFVKPPQEKENQE